MTISQAYTLAAIVVNGCWVAFVALWLLAAFSTKKTVYGETLGQRFLVQIIIAAGVIILINAPREPYPLNVFFIPQNVTMALVSAAVCVCGLAEGLLINPDQIASLHQVGRDVRVWLSSGKDLVIRNNTVVAFAQYLAEEKGIGADYSGSWEFIREDLKRMRGE